MSQGDTLNKMTYAKSGVDIEKEEQAIKELADLLADIMQE